MTERCRACRAGLEHCHGALIHHPYRRDECTEPDCVGAAAEHELHIDCGAVGCACDVASSDALPGERSAHRVG